MRAAALPSPILSTVSTHNGPQPTNRLQNARGAGLLPPGDGDCSVVETALAKLIEQLTASNA